MTSHSILELRQRYFRYWLVAWRHEAITWTDVDLPMKPCGIHLRAFLQEMPFVSQKFAVQGLLS